MARFPARIVMSVTEMPHFSRLVRFLEDAEDHADEHMDTELLELVGECRADLLDIMDDA